MGSGEMAAEGSMSVARAWRRERVAIENARRCALPASHWRQPRRASILASSEPPAPPPEDAAESGQRARVAHRKAAL